jgi:hypothetical protein
MQDRMDLARHHLQPVSPQQLFGLVAPIRQETWRTGGDRSLAHSGGFRKDALGVDLVAPVVRFADPPTRR